MLSDNLASWLIWISFAGLILVIPSIIFFYEAYDYREHIYDKGIDVLATVLRWVLGFALVFTLFYSVFSLQSNHQNRNISQYVEEIKTRYDITLTESEIRNLLAEDEDGAKIDGKTIIAVNYDEAIILLEYKNGKLEELPKK